MPCRTPASCGPCSAPEGSCDGAAHGPCRASVIRRTRGWPYTLHRGAAQARGGNFAPTPTCIVHLLRHSLDFVSWKDRKLVAAALKDIYRAVDAEAGDVALGAFEESLWGRKYP